MKKGRRWLITASGGVEIDSWRVADRFIQETGLTSIRSAARANHSEAWWWD